MNINEKKRQVPFGNSAFQIMNFTANHETPERTYRNILLQLDSKQKAMKECYFRRKRKEIDIREINLKLKTAMDFEEERLKIDLEEAEYGLEEEMKLIEDCAVEIAIYEKLLEGLPEFTREDFENSERLYWRKRFLKQAELELASTGTIGLGLLESIDKMGHRIVKTPDGKFVITDAPDGVKFVEGIIDEENKIEA